jgi:hypothetical protein
MISNTTSRRFPNVGLVEIEERAKYGAIHAAEKASLQEEQCQAIDEANDLRQKLKKTESERDGLPRHVRDSEKPLNMSLLDKIFLAFAALTLAIAACFEQGAAAAMLVNLGAFGVTSLWEARMLLIVPLVAGLVASYVSGGLGLKRVNRCLLQIGLLVMLSGTVLIYVVAFAAQVGIAANAVNQDIVINMDGDEGDHETGSDQSESPLWAWLMLSTSLTAIALTAWLGESFIRGQIEDATPKKANKDFVELNIECNHLRKELHEKQEKITACKSRLAEIAAGEEAAVATALASISN